MPEVTYKGKRIDDWAYVSKVTVGDDGSVTVEELKVDRSLKHRRHSPTGFEWGYNGSGPAQLSLALLLDAGVPVDTALYEYQRFKGAVAQNWRDEWEITAVQILEFSQ